jgi:hypothetical protein
VLKYALAAEATLTIPTSHQVCSWNFVFPLVDA